MGLTHASVKDLSHDVSIVVGQLISVGNEEADPAEAEVVSIDERGIVLVRVLPGTLEHIRFRLRSEARRRADVASLIAPSRRFKSMAWDLWIDFQRRDDDGLTYANVRNASRTFLQAGRHDCRR